MFDIGWQELLVIGVVALVVIGPKDMPIAIRAVSRWAAKARGLAREFQHGLDEVVREAELQDIKKNIEEAKTFDVTGEIAKAVDPTGEVAKTLDLGGVEKELSDSARALTYEPPVDEPPVDEPPPAEPPKPEKPAGTA